MQSNTEYEFKYYNPSGEYQFSVSSWYNAQFWVSEREVGSFYIDVPYELGKQIVPYLDEDGIFEIYRSNFGTKKLLFNKRWFLGLWRDKVDESGLRYLRMRCLGCNNIIDRRIVYYAAGEAETIVTATPADDAIKRILRQNLGSSAATYRDISDYLQIDGDLSLAPNIDVDGFEYRKILPLLQEFCDIAYSQDETYVTFDVTWSPEASKYRFSTFVGQLGADKGINGAQTLYLTTTDRDEKESSSGLSYASVEVNGIDRRTAVYAGGQIVVYDEGLETEYEERTISEAYDNDKIDRTPFGLWEDWEDARETSDADALQDVADKRLREWETKIVVNGHMSDSFTRFFDREFGYGDIVAFKFRGNAYDVHIDKVLFNLDGSGKEEIQIFTRNMEESYY